MYKKGSNSRHNSIISTSSDSELSYISLRVHLLLVDNEAGLSDEDLEQVAEVVPLFSRCRPGTRYELHAHLPASQVLYLGRKPFLANSAGNSRTLQLENESAKHWYAFSRPAVQKQLPTIRIPGGKMSCK